MLRITPSLNVSRRKLARDPGVTSGTQRQWVGKLRRRRCLRDLHTGLTPFRVTMPGNYGAADAAMASTRCQTVPVLDGKLFHVKWAWIYGTGGGVRGSGRCLGWAMCSCVLLWTPLMNSRFDGGFEVKNLSCQSVVDKAVKEFGS